MGITFLNRAIKSTRIQSSTPSKIQAFNKDELKKIATTMKGFNFKVDFKSERKFDVITEGYDAEIGFEHVQARKGEGFFDRIEMNLSATPARGGKALQTDLDVRVEGSLPGIEQYIDSQASAKKTLNELTKNYQVVTNTLEDIRKALEFLSQYVGTNKLG